MTLFEIELVMQELSKHIDDSKTQILFGTGTDKKLGGNLTVTIISSLQGPGGQRREAPAETPGASQKPDTPAPRLGSPLTAPLSPPPAPTSEPEKTTEPVAAVEGDSSSAQDLKKEEKSDAPAPEEAEPEAKKVEEAEKAEEPEPVAEDVAPEPEREAEKEAEVESEQEAEVKPDSEPEKESDVEPESEPVSVEKEEPSPESKEFESSGDGNESEAQPKPGPPAAEEKKSKAPVNLQPVRKTAVVPAKKLRKPVVEVPSKPKLALNVPSAVVSPDAANDDPEAEKVAEVEEDGVDSIGKMLRQGRDGTGLSEGESSEPMGNEDPTLPIKPVPADDESEAVVAQTDDAQKISLSRLVPGVSPSAEDVSPGTLPAQPSIDSEGQEDGGVPVDPDQAALDAAAAQHQQMLQLEPLSKGRFAKTEPTIVDGEDMDVPTFLRKRRK
jgi:hypothetical protein